MRQKGNHTHQLNCKMSQHEYEELQVLNDKLFAGKLNNSDLARFLLNVAKEHLAKAKVETRTVVTVDGVPLTEVK